MSLGSNIVLLAPSCIMEKMKKIVLKLKKSSKYLGSKVLKKYVCDSRSLENVGHKPKTNYIGSI